MPELSKLWQGRLDSEDGEAGTRWFQQVRFDDTPDARLSLVGYASDLGVQNNKGRIGAKAGPEALRQQLANLPWLHDFAFRDAGTTEVTEQLLTGQQTYAKQIRQQLTAHDFVIGLGGGHDIAYGSHLGLKQYLTVYSPEKRVGILNLDAHFDLRKPAPDTSSGTPFRQIAEECQSEGKEFVYTCVGISRAANTQALFNYAEDFGVDYVLDTDCQWDNIKAAADKLISRVDILYVTLCLDALPAAYAPGVSAPSPLGVEPLLVIKLLHYLADAHQQSKVDWPLMDVAELNPTLDVDSRTAKLAARLIFEAVNARLG